MNIKTGQETKLLETNNSTYGSPFLFEKSGVGYELHYCASRLISEMRCEFSWYCLYLNKDFFSILEEFGRLPETTSITKYM